MRLLHFAAALLPHLVEASGHAGQLGTAPVPSVRMLNNVAVKLVDVA